MSEYLTIGEVAEQIFAGRISGHSVRRWIAKGVGVPKVKLPATRMGRDYFVLRDDAEEFKQAVNNPDLYRRRKSTERNERAKKRLEAAGA